MRIWALILLAVAGCSRPAPPPDPEASKLATGAEVIGYGKDGQVAVWDVPEGSASVKSMKLLFVPAGVKLRVISDLEVSDLKMIPGSRMVRVLIIEGEHQMIGGNVWRSDLRPTPTP